MPEASYNQMNPMDLMNRRPWIFFFLICFVAMLWATFLLAQGVMLWVGVMLIIIVLGFNFILISSEITKHHERQELMKIIGGRGKKD